MSCGFWDRAVANGEMALFTVIPNCVKTSLCLSKALVGFQSLNDKSQLLISRVTGKVYC